MSESLVPGSYEQLNVDDNLTLKSLSRADAESLFSLVDGNREYLGNFLPWVNQTTSTEDSLEFIKKTEDERAQGLGYGFGMYVEGALAGHISLMNLEEGKRPEIGYWIAEDVSGKGITSKAAKTIGDFGFNNLGIKEIIIKAEPNNIASNSIAKRLGYELFETELEDNREFNVWRKVSE